MHLQPLPQQFGSFTLVALWKNKRTIHTTWCDQYHKHAQPVHDFAKRMMFMPETATWSQVAPLCRT